MACNVNTNLFSFSAVPLLCIQSNPIQLTTTIIANRAIISIVIIANFISVSLFLLDKYLKH